MTQSISKDKERVLIQEIDEILANILANTGFNELTEYQKIATITSWGLNESIKLIGNKTKTLEEYIENISNLGKQTLTTFEELSVAYMLARLHKGQPL